MLLLSRMVKHFTTHLIHKTINGIFELYILVKISFHLLLFLLQDSQAVV